MANQYDREFEKAAEQLAPTFQLIAAIQALADHQDLADMAAEAGIEVAPATEEVEKLVAAMQACGKKAQSFFDSRPKF